MEVLPCPVNVNFSNNRGRFPYILYPFFPLNCVPNKFEVVFSIVKIWIRKSVNCWKRKRNRRDFFTIRVNLIWKCWGKINNRDFIRVNLIIRCERKRNIRDFLRVNLTFGAAATESGLQLTGRNSWFSPMISNFSDLGNFDFYKGREVSRAIRPSPKLPL